MRDVFSCRKCGKKDERTEKGRVFCAACAKADNKKALNRYYSRKSEQRCVNCGESDSRTLKGKTLCFACAVKDSDRREKRKDRSERQL